MAAEDRRPRFERRWPCRSIAVSSSVTANVAANSCDALLVALTTLYTTQVANLHNLPRNRPHGAVGVNG